MLFSRMPLLEKRKLIPSLEAVGASIDSVAKAQVYLTDAEDVPGFNEIWLSYFKNPPATTIIATGKPGIAINDLRIEINTISVTAKGTTKREVIRGPATGLSDVDASNSANPGTARHRHANDLDVELLQSARDQGGCPVQERPRASLENRGPLEALAGDLSPSQENGLPPDGLPSAGRDVRAHLMSGHSL